jgi:hypothetical protein
MCLKRVGIDRYIGLQIYLADTDTDISVSANWISVLAYRYRLLARLISAISVLAKYRLQSLDIGPNIGLYRLWKNIGIGIGGRYVYPNI